MKPVILPRTRVLTASIATLVAATCTAQAQQFWDGSDSTDWNFAANWSGNAVPSGANAVIDISSGNIAKISSDLSATPVDILVGSTTGTNGRLDQTAGIAGTGSGNWMFVGVAGGTGTFNLANTAATGGTLTGYGQGTGSMNVGGNNATAGRLYVGGRDNGTGGTGTVNVNTTGTLKIGNDLDIGTRGGTGTFNLDAGTVTTNGWNFIGFQNGGPAGGNGALNMSGGSITNGGARTFVGLGNTAGSLTISGGVYNNTRTGDNSTQFAIGVQNLAAATPATVTMSGGTLNAERLFAIGGTEAFGGDGNGGFLGAGRGAFVMNGASAVLNVTGELWVGNLSTSVGTMDVSAGLVKINNWVAVGRNSSTGTLTLSGTGRIEKTGNGNFEVGGATGTGTFNLDGGTLNTQNITKNGSGTGTVNLNGGLLQANVSNTTFLQGLTNVFVKGGGARIDTQNFDITIAQALKTDAVSLGGGLTKTGAGTLTLSGASTFTGNISVNAGTLVGAFTNIGNPTTGAFGDATIFGRTITVAANATLRLTVNDSFGNAAAVAANLPSLIINGTLSTTRYNQIGALTLNGATLSSTNTTDSGNYQNFQFLGAVTVTGSAPSFITTSGVANFNANHLATATTFDVADVTGNANSDLMVSAPFRDQSGNYGLVAGGLVKTGAGTMELTASSVYTGLTTVSNGTLRLNGTGSVNNSSGITVNGSGAKLVQTSSTAVVPVVSLLSGTVDGVGNIGTLNVADLATNVIANGNGTAGAVLSIDALSFLGAGKLNLSLNGTGAGILTQFLTANGPAGAITVDASNALWNNGSSYDLISYIVLTGSLSNFTKGTVTGLGARQSATLGDSGTAIILSIAGDLPRWTGAGDANWTTAIQTPKNWRLQTGGTGTDFLVNDTVVFEDTQSVNTNVTIAQNVTPVSTTFSNSTKNYTLVSPGGFGIAGGSLVKNGTGDLTLGGNHTYTGTTQLLTGLTNLTGTLGNTAVTVALGATLSLQSAGGINQNVVTVNGTLTENVANALSGTAAIVFNNGATLNVANAHSGGTTISNGALNLGHAGALGTGPLTVTGGTLDNTSGAPMTLTGNNPIRLAADLMFTGTNALNFGTGAVTLGNDASTQLISIVAGNTLTFGGPVTTGVGGTSGVKTLSLTGSDVTFTGNLATGSAASLVISNNLPGTLKLSGAASSFSTLNINGGPASVVDLGAGNLSLGNGGGNILQSTTGGTINASGGTLTIGSANGDFGTAGGTTLTVNAPLAGSNAVDFYNSNGGVGLGRIILAAANTNSGAINVENTNVVVPSGGSITTVGQVTVGTVAGAPATLDIIGGTLNANRTAAAPSLQVGSANGANAALNVTSGTVNVANELWIANAPGSMGTMTQSSGTTTVNSWLAIGRDRGNGTLNLSGGVINKTGGAGNYIIIGSLGGTGTVTQTGGAFNATAGGIRLGENTGATPSLNTIWDMQGGTSTVGGEINVAWLSSQATWNVSGNAVVTASGRLIVGASVNNIAINSGPIINGAPVGTVNISGGSVTFNGGDNRIGGDSALTGTNSNATATGIVNVSGGTLTFVGHLQVGAYGKGTLDISGNGVVNSNGGFPSVGRFLGSTGALTLNGGTFINLAATQVIIGEEGTGTLTLNSGLVEVGDLRVGHLATGNGTVNLNGGMLSLSAIQKTVAGSTAAIKFNGGTLRTKVGSLDLLAGFDASSLTIENGGAKIDTTTNNVTITQGLAPGAGSTGGLTKMGNGVLNLTGASTYTGPTSIDAGTLSLTGSISGSTSITVKAGAAFEVVGVGGGFALANGQTLRGNGSVSGNVAMNLGAKLAPGESAGTLTFNSTLDLTAAVTPDATGALQFELGSVASSDKVAFTTGALTIGSGVLAFNDFAFSTLPGFGAGTYTLFDGTAGIGGTLDPNAAHLSGSLGGNATGTLSLADGGNDLVLLVTVPEPGSAVLLLGGLAALAGFRRNRRARTTQSESFNA